MSTANTPPRIDSELSKMKKRIDALERRLNDLASIYRPEIVFSFSGPLTPGESPTWTRREAGRLIEVHARLRVAGTTDTVIEIHKNGEEVLTVTVPAGQAMVRVPTSIFFAADMDVLHDVLTTAGTGAIDLTVMHRFRR